MEGSFELARIAHAPSGEILEWNDAAANLYGWPASEALGQDFFNLVYTGFPEPLEDVIAVLEDGKTWTGVLIQAASDGSGLCVKTEWRLEDGLFVQTCREWAKGSEAISSGPIAASLLDTYPGSVFVLDLRDYRTVLLRGRQFTSLGYSHEEINALGKDLTPKLLHPDDLEILPIKFAEFAKMEKGETREHVHRVRAKNGAYRCISTTASVFAWDAEGNPTHIVGYALDVTDNQDAARTLILLQDQLKFALSATGMVAWIWDNATDDVVRVGNIKGIFGDIEPNADAFMRAVHPDDWHLSEESIERAKNGNPMDGIQMRIIRSDGQVRWIEERGAMHHDANGNPTHQVGVTIDVTEQRRKDEFNRRTHRSLRLALHAARACTWQWDCLTNLIVVSDEAFDLFGLPRGAPPTMGEWLHRIHPDDRDHFRAEAHRTANQGIDLFIDFRVVMPDGIIKPVRAVAQRASDESGYGNEVIGIVMDLSIFSGNFDRRSTDRAA
jgi:PAS domain S-box-containing protein